MTRASAEGGTMMRATLATILIVSAAIAVGAQGAAPAPVPRAAARRRAISSCATPASSRRARV